MLAASQGPHGCLLEGGLSVRRTPVEGPAMRYDPRIATTSPEEFAELMALVRRADEAPRPQTDDDVWRATYAEEQRQRRVVGYQQDLFGSKATTHFRRNRAAPDWDRPPVEAIEQKLERIKGDPAADRSCSRSRGQSRQRKGLSGIGHFSRNALR